MPVPRKPRSTASKDSMNSKPDQLQLARDLIALLEQHNLDEIHLNGIVIKRSFRKPSPQPVPVTKKTDTSVLPGHLTQADLNDQELIYWSVPSFSKDQ